MFEIPPIGTRIADKYLVTGLLGEGGMSVVLKARHLARDATVAIKLIRPEFCADPQAVGRLKQEALAASRLRTDHAVSVFDVGELPDQRPFLVMEFLEGEDLEQVLAREQKLAVPRAVHIVLQVLRALAVGHDVGVIHRDLKPANVHLSERDGEPEFAKLLDFGISHIASVPGVRLTANHQLMGTPVYMSPEQALDPRDVVPASDLYAVGVLLYECLSGRPPLYAETIEAMLHRVFVETPTRLDEVDPTTPARLADVVARALAKDVQQRFGSAREMALALAPFSDERSSRVLSSFEPQNVPSRRDRRESGEVLTVALTKHPTLKHRFGMLGLFAIGCAAVVMALVTLMWAAPVKTEPSRAGAPFARDASSSLPEPKPPAASAPAAPAPDPKAANSVTASPVASQRSVAPGGTPVRPRRAAPQPASPFELEILR